MFSIMIPTWRGDEYLNLCCKHLEDNSYWKSHEILVWANESKSAGVERPEFDYKFITSLTNEGVSKPLNEMAKIAKHEILIYLNHDMIVCKNWDRIIWDFSKNFNIDECILMGHWVVPKPGDPRWSCVDVWDYGETPDKFEGEMWRSFDEEKRFLSFKDHYYSARPPYFLTKKLWNRIGGCDESFLAASDDDFMYRAHSLGIRDYVCCVDWLVYHFASNILTPTAEGENKKWRPGREAFRGKWGFEVDELNQKILKVGRKWENES